MVVACYGVCSVEVGWVGVGGMGKRRKTWKECIKYGAVGGVKRKKSTCAREESEYWRGC